MGDGFNTRDTVEIRYTIPRSLHTKLRCKAAEKEMTMKAFVTQIFEEAASPRPKGMGARLPNASRDV